MQFHPIDDFFFTIGMLVGYGKIPTIGLWCQFLISLINIHAPFELASIFWDNVWLVF